MSHATVSVPRITVGLDLGDRYSRFYLLDKSSGVIEEGRLRTTPDALREEFADRSPMRIVIEVGTHSPWVSRALEACGHDVLVANARKIRLIYANDRKSDRVDAESSQEIEEDEVSRSLDENDIPRRAQRLYGHVQGLLRAVRDDRVVRVQFAGVRAQIRVALLELVADQPAQSRAALSSDSRSS